MFQRFLIFFILFLVSKSTFSQQKDRVHTIPDSLLQQFPLDREVRETSGLIFREGLLWTHNDDNDNTIYGINPSSGVIERRISIGNLKIADWEELQHDEQYLYIGDFGNNAKGNRTDLRIFRKKKNSDKPDTILFRYPEQTDFTAQKTNSTNFDCEAFIVTDSMIYLFTKEWISTNTSLYKIPNKPGSHEAKRINTFSSHGLITGAAFNPGTQLIVLTGYTKTLAPFIYLLYGFQKDDYFSGSRQKLKISHRFMQIEAAAFLDDWTIALTNEEFNHSFVKSPPKLTIINLRPLLDQQH